MDMKRLTALIAFIAAIGMVSCDNTQGYRISGVVADTGLNGKYIYLYGYGASSTLLDSARVENGSFTFEGERKDTLLCILRFADGVIDAERYRSEGGFLPFSPWFVLENKAKLTVRIEEHSTVEGSAENNDLTAYMQQLTPLYDSLSGLMERYRNGDEAQKKEIEAGYEQTMTEVTAISRDYIRNHTNSLSAAQIFYEDRYTLPEDRQREIIALAGETFKSDPRVGKIIEHLAVLEKVAVGKKFSDIELPDPEGKSHKLSEYVGNGKVVLIDFWASWCGPCRADMPHVTEVYKQYKNKGFEIVGLSLDRDGDAWKKGIKDLNITWPQLSDLKYWQSAAAALYGVNSIPHTVLIDREGVIIAKDLRGESLDTKLAEVLK
jgi:peroxiredoxin